MLLESVGKKSATNTSLVYNVIVHVTSTTSIDVTVTVCRSSSLSTSMTHCISPFSPPVLWISLVVLDVPTPCAQGQ